ncbi:MAG: hypothetical protein Q7R43_00375, partial [Candidatus Daviesbacteria bacterium]|nr:hypothetical protein [Candidatus Daviesbacteria bacterium]
QDLVTELYQFEKNPTHEEKLDTVERYHQILVNTVRKSNFNILEGEDVYLETHALEPLETVQRRVPGLETNPRIFPIPVIWDCGSLRPVLRRNLLTSIDKANKTATEKAIDDHGEELVTKYFPQYQKYGGHLLEILNMRYLTAEKPKADSTSVKLGFLSNLRKYFFPKAI